MVELILVSHSEALANATITLAKQMAKDVVIHNAAGIDDSENPIGTDAVKILTALESVGEAEAVILVDLGSAILSTQTALDLCDSNIADRVSIVAAPFVEGAISAAVAAQGGADRESVCKEAASALAPKYAALEPSVEIDDKNNLIIPLDAKQKTVTIRNPHGLHARPAAKLATLLKPYQAEMVLEKNGELADPTRVNSIATLQIQQGDNITLYASGIQASEALSAFTQLAAENFGEMLNVVGKTPTRQQNIKLPVQLKGGSIEIEQPIIPAYKGEDLVAFTKAYQQCLTQLSKREKIAQTQYGELLGEIFSAQQMMLEELYDDTLMLQKNGVPLFRAWQNVCQQAIDSFAISPNPYMRARQADIVDLQNEMNAILMNTPRLNPFEKVSVATAICQDIYPSQTLTLSKSIAWIITEQGNTDCHAAQICAAMGVVYSVR